MNRKKTYVFALPCALLLIGGCYSFFQTQHVTSTETTQTEPTPSLATSPTDDTPLLEGESFPYDAHHLYALEYLSYNLEGVEHFVPDDLPLFSTGGDEYYKITPRYDNMSIQIYQIIFDEYAEDFERRELIYTYKEAEPFYIKGNQSDIFPNICVILTTPDGDTTEIIPYVSLKDGSIIISDEGYLVP